MSDLEISPPFDPEDLPLEMEDDDMSFDLLEHVMPGDHVYFAMGSAIELFVDITAPDNYDLDSLFIYLTPLGELAEKPGKVDSKIDKLKSRNYQIPGKRSTTVELSLNGLSNKMMDYLESPLFSGVELTILIMDEAWDPGMFEVTRYKCLLLDAMQWTVDWSVEADGLWTVTLSTVVSGSTQYKIIPFTSETWIMP